MEQLHKELVHHYSDKRWEQKSINEKEINCLHEIDLNIEIIIFLNN